MQKSLDSEFGEVAVDGLIYQKCNLSSTLAMESNRVLSKVVVCVLFSSS